MTLIAALGLSWLTFLVGFVAGAWWAGRDRPVITRLVVTDVLEPAREGRVVNVACDGSTSSDAVDAVIEASRP